MSEPSHQSSTFQEIASQLSKGQSIAARPLPDVDRVVAIARDIRTLLFPQGSSSTDARGTSELELRCLLTRISARLTHQVTIALSHADGAGLQVHAPQSQSNAHIAAAVVRSFVGSLPAIQNDILLDVEAAFDGDPAARTRDEIFMCYPGIEAVMIYRFAHRLHQLEVPYLPRILTEWAHRETGIDIHPGAQIGPRFFIDHGTGVVIGETTIIGSAVTLYQGVTLGAWSFPRDEDGELIRGAKRHPTLEDNVVVYSNASILGGDTVVGSGSQIGSGVTLSRSILPGTVVTVERPSLRIREAAA